MDKSFHYGTKRFIRCFFLLKLGVIDAAVSGGVVQLVDIFFNPAYMEANPDKSNQLRKLKTVLKTQSKILTEGLQLHKKLVPANMVALHEKLEGLFNLESINSQFFSKDGNPMPE